MPPPDPAASRAWHVVLVSGAIEDAARNLEEFSDKQHFLNSIYERFFQGYSVKLADTHGSTDVTRSMVSASVAPWRRSFTCNEYWRKPVVSAEYASRFSSSLNTYAPTPRKEWPFASSFRSSVVRREATWESYAHGEL